MLCQPFVCNDEALSKGLRVEFGVTRPEGDVALRTERYLQFLSQSDRGVHA